MRALDLSGQTLGRWQVLGRATSRQGKSYWRCRCACGNEREIRGSDLVGGWSMACQQCATHEWTVEPDPAGDAPPAPVEPPGEARVSDVDVFDSAAVSPEALMRDGWHISQLGLTRRISEKPTRDSGRARMSDEVDPFEW